MKNFLILIFFFSLFFNAKAFSFEGTFIVPVENEELLSYSKLRVKDIQISPDYLRITMPSELASTEAYSIKFERNSEGVNTLNSFFGSAHCLQETISIIKCKISFNALYKNVLTRSLWKTMDYIQSTTSNVDDLTNKLLIAEWFSSMPKGILIIDLAD